METRVDILQMKAAAMRVKLPNDVAQFLATHVRNNVRELEGALTRVMAFSNLMRGPLTVEVCRDVLKSLLIQRGQRPEIEQIIKRCADCFRVSVNDIKGHVRKRQFARARQVAMYLGRKLTGLSYPELGDRFGGKDHSTVINAVQRIPELMGKDEELRLNVESLERELSAPL
jgi:chromosomal replication initiator protein